jgi:hypothetical protein
LIRVAHPLRRWLKHERDRFDDRVRFNPKTRGPLLMWKHYQLFVCALVVFISGTTLFLTAQDPSFQPLVQFGHLNYIGAFRLPRAGINGDDLSFGGRPFAFNAARNSLFVGSKVGRVAEVSIPDLVNSVDVNTMFFAKYLQGLTDPLEGNIWQVASTDAAIEGILVDGDKLLGTAAIYYDAQNSQRVSHYKRSTSLTTLSFNGFVPMWQPDHMGFVSGYMATVPPEWRAKLGGPAISGQCCTPIAWKTSWGPSAFAFNPADIGVTSPVPATPLLYYSHDHPTLGHWQETGTAYGGTTRINGVAIIGGTRTALFFGSTGAGTPCYGNGTSDESLHNKSSNDGTLWCYDPTSTDKGQHAFPYRYQIWAYDLNELAAVREGRKQPWEVMPYGVWPFELPIPEIHAKLGGVAYDSQRQVLYISQLLADKDTFANRALIHALRVSTVPPSIAPPVATTGPTPSGSGTVQQVVLSTDKAAPQPPGTTVTWTATATGGITPYEYKWMTNDGSGWKAGTWTAANTFAWTPTAPTEYHRVSVWVRSYAATPDIYEASDERWYPISGTAPPPTGPVPTPKPTSVAVTSNLTPPQAAGTTITWTATVTGGVAPFQYKWFASSGGVWTVLSDWSSSATFAWRPTAAAADARIGVWVRSAGITADTREGSTEQSFAIVTAPAVPVPPPVVPTAPVTGVALSASLPSPQVMTTSVTWTATPAGGGSSYLYKWFVLDGGWAPVTSWVTSNQFVWTPTVANDAYRVGVWIKRASNSADALEASAEVPFVITARPATLTRPTAVTLMTNLTAPQGAGTTISLTALAGTGAFEYKWFIFNGGWSAVTGWVASNTYQWTPAAANTGYKIGVWVRAAGSTQDTLDVSAEKPFSITAKSTQPVSSVRLTSNITPSRVGETVRWTATPVGGAAPHQYQWLVFDFNWNVIASWTGSNTFDWTPSKVNADYRVGVWVRGAGSTTPMFEASAEVAAPIRQ